ncbi:hypothetical protein V494_00452 [Pseudogymnoascus sp. VKM F-4513 (FW-928)]|nr:hypothetical protein V494_00452 [Pseudogymnoascus sp. VKM F-4513 (FW-928)]
MSVPPPSETQNLAEPTAEEDVSNYGTGLPVAVPPLSEPQRPAEPTDMVEASKDGIGLPVAVPSSSEPQKLAEPSAREEVSNDRTELSVAVAAPIPPPSLTSTHSHPTTSLSLSNTAPPASASTASVSTSPSSTDTQTLTSARAALEATILSTGTAYTHPIEARARDLHAMNTALATQQTQLLSATGALAKENDRLSKLAEEGGRRLKEVGALDVWAEVLEGDLAAVEECLRIVEGGGEEHCESCGGDLATVEEDAVRWCGGCDGLWHAGCCGEEGASVDAAGKAEGSVADNDGGVEWRCRECALREDLEAMVGELGGFVDDEMDTSGEITAEPPREDVMEEARDWKGKGVAYPQDEDANMGVEGGAAGETDVLGNKGLHAEPPKEAADVIQSHEATNAPDGGDRPLETGPAESESEAPPRRAVWTWGVGS